MFGIARPALSGDNLSYMVCNLIYFCAATVGGVIAGFAVDGEDDGEGDACGEKVQNTWYHMITT